MKKTVAGLVLLFACIQGFAQRSEILADRVTGNIYKGNEMPGITGSPFLFEDWLPGTLFMKDGAKALQMQLRYDAYQNEVLFLHEGKPLVVVNPLIEFLITPSSQPAMRFRCGYQATERNTDATFYQVVYDGKVSLLKHLYKKITETSEYNRASIQRELTLEEAYYIARAGLPPVKIKKDRASVLKALDDADGKFAAWLDKNRNRCRSEEDIIEALKAYNDGSYRSAVYVKVVISAAWAG